MEVTTAKYGVRAKAGCAGGERRAVRLGRRAGCSGRAFAKPARSPSFGFLAREESVGRKCRAKASTEAPSVSANENESESEEGRVAVVERKT